MFEGCGNTLQESSSPIEAQRVPLQPEIEDVPPVANGRPPSPSSGGAGTAVDLNASLTSWPRENNRAPSALAIVGLGVRGLSAMTQLQGTFFLDSTPRDAESDYVNDTRSGLVTSFRGLAVSLLQTYV